MLVLQGTLHAAAKALGDRAEVDEEGIFGRMNQTAAHWIPGNAGNDEVDVRVMLDLAAPGMEHTCDAGTATAGLGGGDVLKRGSAFTQDELIEDFGIGAAERPELFGQGEGCHEVGNRQKPGLLFGGPNLLIERTTLRATAMVAAMIGIMFGSTPLTLIETTTKLGRTAREDAPHGPVMVGVEVLPVGTGIIQPVLAEQVCEMQGHEGNRWLLDSGQCGEGGASLGLADLGEVEIDEGGLEGGVAEVGGDLAQAGAGVEHVSGVAVTEGVGADFVVLFGQAAFGAGDVHGGPGAGVGHGPAAVVEGLLQADAGASPTASGRGKEPVGIAVPGPEAAQAEEQFRADGNFAGLAALGVGDAQDEARAVDVFRPDVEGLAETQAALIDEGEVGAVTAVAKGAQELGDFLAGEDVGQWLDALNVDFRPDLPGLAEMVAVKGAQGADGLVEGGSGELAVGL